MDSFTVIPRDQVSDKNLAVDENNKCPRSNEFIAEPKDNNQYTLTTVEELQTGRNQKGRYFLYIGLAMVMIIFELDNSTVGTYRNFAASEFGKLSMLATLNTVTSIISAVSKPPIAKVSDVIGRAKAYIITTTSFIISYVMCASSRSFGTYTGGCIFYALGQAGTSMLNSIVVSDISSMRWRGFAYNIIYVPFLITPWISAFIVDSVINGIGWRWGIGMFTILMPFSASFIIIALLVLQHRSRRSTSITTQPLSFYRFCSGIDLGGITILTCGLTLLLIPVTLAATTTDRWKTPWIDSLIVLGAGLLACLYPYERYIARYPVIPSHYFRTYPIVLSVALACLDSVGFGTTHTYLYLWSMVSHNFSARNAQFLSYTSGVIQALAGMVTGLMMYRMRRYKWIGVGGAIIRLIGYGLMIRLRTNTSSIAELFIVQVIQGTGSGIIETVSVVAAQISVPHTELAQVTSLIGLGAFVGNAIGSAIAGGIYTGKLWKRLQIRLDGNVDEARVSQLYDSITGTLPLWGTVERTAVNEAYSDVIGYITFAALAISVPVVGAAFIMPDKHLADDQNLVQQPSLSDSSTSNPVTEQATAK